MRWPEVELGAVVKPVSRFEAPLPGTNYRQIGVRLWGGGAYERETIDGSGTQYKQLLRVAESDIVVNKIWARNGSVAVVTRELHGCYGSPEFPTFEIDTRRLLPRWFHWLTKSPTVWRQCDMQSRGTSGKNRLRPEKFLRIKIPLPAPELQRQVVTHLDGLSDRIETQKREREAFDRELNALLLAAFARVTAGAPYRRMSDLAPIVRRPVQIQPDRRYPELGVRSFGRGVFHKPNLSGSDITWEKLFAVEQGDIVISNIKAWEGAIAVASAADHGRFGSHRYLTCVPSGLATPHFLAFYLLTREGVGKIQAASPGSADRNRTLGMDALMAISAPAPPLEKQRRFEDLLAKVREVRTLLIDAEAELDALVSSALNHILTERVKA